VDGVKTALPTDQRLELSGRMLEAGGKKFAIEGKPAYIEQGVLFINGQPQKSSKNVYGFMIHELLPVGVKGLVAAALLAALMSTVSGALNSIATLFSFDIVKRWRPHTTDRTLVKIGRITTFVAMVVAIAWSPFIERFESMYQGIIALICYIAPPITAVFVLGVLWRRASDKSAQLTLYIGSALGFVVFLLDMFKDRTGWNVPSMMATFYLLVTCVVVQVAIALVVPHRHTPESERLVWGNPLDAIRSPGWRGIGDYRILAAILVITMIALYAIFA
jgi:SSS family solute:Na+ symporter